MRQHHVAGEKAFVDYSGKRIAIVDPTTGEIHEAEIFVGVLGASNLTYAEATWTQQLPDWTGAHVRMFRFFGGVPKLLVPDNLKSGAARAQIVDRVHPPIRAFAAGLADATAIRNPKNPARPSKAAARRLGLQHRRCDRRQKFARLMQTIVERGVGQFCDLSHMRPSCRVAQRQTARTA